MIAMKSCLTYYYRRPQNTDVFLMQLSSGSGVIKLTDNI